jgi:hypothetical protein
MEEGTFKVLGVEGDAQMERAFRKAGVLPDGDNNVRTEERKDESVQSNGKPQEQANGRQEQANGSGEGRQEPVQEVVDKPFDVKSVFGDGFESVDDVKAALKRFSKRPDIEVDEELQAFIEAKKAGYSLDEYTKVVKADYNSLSDAEVVKLKLMAEKPHLTAEEINDLYEDEYGFDEEADEERLVRTRKVRLKDAAVTARAELNEKKTKYTPKAAQNKGVQEAAKVAWKESVEKFALDEIVVSKGDKEVVRYKVDANVLGSVKGELSEMEGYFKPYLKGDGSVDMNALVSDRLKAKLFDEVVASAATLSASKGREEVVERRNNVERPSDTRKPIGDEDKAAARKAYEVLKKAGF